jgi:hypothetical protein
VRPDERQLADLFAEMRRTLDRLERGEVVTGAPGQVRATSAFELLRLGRTPLRDGYPTSSSGSGGGGESDPTLSAVVAREKGDPIRAERDRMVSALRHARTDLRDALAAVMRATPPPAGPGEPGCRVHEAAGLPWEPVEKDRVERCWWCHDWWITYGEDPIAGVLARRARGDRITSKVIAEEYAAANRKPPVERRPRVSQSG